MLQLDKIGAILEKVTNSLQNVPGIQGIVLGGSRARGNATADSDIDIGIYYDEPKLDIAKLDAVARELDDERRDGLICPPGGWGKWVNAGGWLVIEDFPVDFILKDIGRVKNIIDDCRKGIVAPHYQTGHPHAYIDAMYMGELAISQVLWDKDGEIARLKAIAEVYPPKLKETIVWLFSFEAGFSHMLAARVADKDDVYYVTAHIVRSISCLNQILFAINEEYCLNEKKAVGIIENFRIKPSNYKKKTDEVFALVGKNPSEACRKLKDLIDEVSALT